MMKKGMAIVMALALAVSLCATAALASGRHHTAGTAGTWSQGWNYVDADGDGVCDNLGTGTCGQGRYCVDADGDGVCDNLGTGTCGHWGHSRGGCRN